MRITFIELLMVACILFIAAGGAAGAIRKSAVEQRCHNAGFPDVRYAGLLAPFGPTYCVKRVNQTDSVVALNKVR